MLTPTRHSVLVVDADHDCRRAFVRALEEAGVSGAESTSYADAMDRLDGFAYDGLIVDVRIPGGDGLDVLDLALSRYPGMRCVVTAGFGSIHHAVRALKAGAIDYFIKPVAAVQVRDVLTRAFAAKSEEPGDASRARTGVPPTFSEIVGTSPAMQQLFETLRRVAPMQSTVLIQGETGTGKELVAKTIHEHSPRRDFPFVAFNAAAIPEGLAEAELFGHVKGAFTGAVYARVGRFEAADRGTLFIDEVSSMSMALQTKLLRALQEREVERVGTSRPLKINARVIAACNEDLADLVRTGRFRQDLYYRLNVVRVSLPALRVRPEDIPVLAQHFVDLSCRTNNLDTKFLSQSTLQVLMRHAWPGNVRQLQNAIESAVVMSGSDREVLPLALPPEILHPIAVLPRPVEAHGAPAPPMPNEGIDFAHTMSRVERELILTYLQKAGGNKRQAARMLKLSRTTLIDKLHRLGVSDTGSGESVDAVA